MYVNRVQHIVNKRQRIWKVGVFLQTVVNKV